jgi:hypothetical protein
MSVAEILAYATFAVNLLLLPLMKLLWDIKIEVTKLNGRIVTLERHARAIERRHELVDHENREQK